MNCFRKTSFFLFGFALILCACVPSSKPQNKIEFYTLEYSLSQKTGLKSIPVVIRIERFSVAPMYNTTRMIYRDSSFKRNAYVLNKWRANPGNLVTYFLGRDIKQSGLFKAVLPHDSGFPSSYVLEGSVDEFFEWDTEEWEAVLSLAITLMVQDEPDISKRVLFQKTYQAKKPCKEKHPSALARAMSLAMKEVSDKILEDVYTVLKDRNL
jgi:cholesterol transport system auxiliary component